jgi:UDP-N-acetylmuramyl pentapeptide synthase
MGMNHPGEIAYLTRLARPRRGAGQQRPPRPSGRVGSVDAVARAKGEIFDGLAADGTPSSTPTTPLPTSGADERRPSAS